MKFSFSEEQQGFRDVVRRFLDTHSDTDAVRKAMESDSGWDSAVWRQFCDEMELPATHIPEAYGGHGFGVTELGLLCEEMGRALYCGPFFGSAVMATTAIVKTGTDSAKQRFLPDLAQGRALAALALAEASGSWRTEDVAMQAETNGGTWRLSGEKTYVVDGLAADHLIVVARIAGTKGTEGVSVFAIDAEARGVGRSALQTLDPTRRLARVTFDNAEAELISGEGSVAAAVNNTIDIAAICLANEMVGGAARLLESAVEYSKMRIQFGRPIGSFQALKHKAADMLTDIELAKSAAYCTASAVDDGDDDLPALASLAKAVASDAYMQTAIHTLQMHGGIGFTWENDTHLWFKRAKSSEVFLGTASAHRERMVEAMGL